MNISNLADYITIGAFVISSGVAVATSVPKIRAWIKSILQETLQEFFKKDDKQDRDKKQ